MPPQPLNIETSYVQFFSLCRNKIKHLGPLCYSICFVHSNSTMFWRSRFWFFFFFFFFFGLFCFSFVVAQLLLWDYYLTHLMVLLALLFVPLTLLFIPVVLLFGCWLDLLVASWFLLLLVSSYVIAIWFLLLLDSSYCYAIPFCCVVWLLFFLLLDSSCYCSTL